MNLLVTINPSPPLFVTLSPKQISLERFLRIRVSPSDVTWKTICSALFKRNIFEYRPDIKYILITLNYGVFSSCLQFERQVARVMRVIFLLSPKVTRVLEYLGFIRFSSNFTMCDVEPEYEINVSLSVCLFDVFAINSYFVDYIFCEAVCRLCCGLFVLVVIFFFLIGNLQ